MTDETEATQGLPEGEAVANAAEETSATAAETTEEPKAEPEAKAEEEGEKRTPWFQKRIDDLTRARYDEKRRADALEAMLASYRKGDTAEPDAGEKDLLPKSEIQRLAKEEAVKLNSEEQFNRESNAAYDKGKAEFSDWDDALSTFRMLGGLNRDVIDAALATGEGHKVLYALGKDPDKASEILSLPPTRMAVALTKLAAPAAPKAKAISAAPAPVKPVDGGSRVLDDPDKMTMDEFVKWRERTTK